MQDDRKRLKESLLILTRWAAIFGMPLIAFLSIFSKPILSLAYGLQYSTAAIPSALICVANLILISSSFIMNMYIAMGRPNIHRSASFTRTIIFLIMIYPAVKHFGLTGAAISILVTMSLLLTIQVVYLKKLLGIRYREYISSWVEGIALCLIVVIPGILLKTLTSPDTIRDLLIGILLCFTAWGFGINKVLRLYRKDLLRAETITT